MTDRPPIHVGFFCKNYVVQNACNPSYLGQTTHRRSALHFGIRQADRLHHTYILGKTGVGKSTLLENLALQDLAGSRGFALIDPHGDLAERVWGQASDQDRARIRYLDAPDSAQPFGYNPVRHLPPERIPLAASGLLETFRKLWPSAWGVRMEHILRNSLYALMERDGSTLADVLRLYADAYFRQGVVSRLKNQAVRRFWTDEFNRYTDRQQSEIVAPIRNKLGALLADPLIHRILVAPAEDLHFRTLMDEGQVLLVNLAKGRIGEDAATLLGSILVSTLGLAAMSRADMEPATRRPFFLFVDEFQSFTTLSFVNLLSELRKSAVGLVLANQYLQALAPEIRHAVLGNAGTLISFRVGPEDASVMAKEFQPVFGVEDLLNLPNRHLYLKLMIEGAPSKPFSARTLDANEPSASLSSTSRSGTRPGH